MSFAILCLIHEKTSFFFSAWMRGFLSLLILQVFVALLLVLFFSLSFATNDLMYQILYFGAFLALTRANGIVKELLGGISIDVSSHVSSLKSFFTIKWGDFLKFIFPQNYNLKPKLFGFIDYSTAIFNAVWAAFLFCFVYLFLPNFSVQVSVFIVLYLPVFLLSIISGYHENMLSLFLLIFRFFKNRKVYLFQKDNSSSF